MRLLARALSPGGRRTSAAVLRDCLEVRLGCVRSGRDSQERVAPVLALESLLRSCRGGKDPAVIGTKYF